MNRRGFLQFLAAATTTAVLDPERLLWVPGEKKIFIPKTPEVRLATEQDMTWLMNANLVAFRTIYAPSEVDRTMSPFWKYYYLEKQGLR